MVYEDRSVSVKTVSLDVLTLFRDEYIGINIMKIVFLFPTALTHLDQHMAEN